MSELPGDLLYTRDHEWLRREDDGSVTIGITDHAQGALVGGRVADDELINAVVVVAQCRGESGRDHLRRVGGSQVLGFRHHGGDPARGVEPDRE